MNPARISGQMPATRGRTEFVLYWMQQSQRVDYNHALNKAAELASAWQIPLITVFVLSDEVPDANLRHYRFMLEGLAETAQRLSELGIAFYLCSGKPDEVIATIAGKSGFVVTDRGYLRWQRLWREQLYAKLGPERWLEVESDTVVPVEIVSNKEEYSAATIRGKILKHLENWLEPVEGPDYSLTDKAPPTIPGSIAHLEVKPRMRFAHLWKFATQHLRIDLSVGFSTSFSGGYNEAYKRWVLFLFDRLRLYAEKRNDPSLNIQSNLSPWLHFGQLSALEVALAALEYNEVPAQDKVSVVEDLLKDCSEKKRLAFVGDGINDAPVLARADIGIAMGALGSDAAIEAADVVLMDDDPLKIAKAIKISRKCIGIVKQNIVFALGVKILCLLLAAVGIANMWLAIVADVGVMILAVFNAIRALYVKNL